MRIGPALSYYGSKWRAAIHYPPPRHDTIVEPFAGAAGYALLHYRRDVTLVDSYEPIAEVWRYLIAAEPEQILALPDIEPGQTVDDLNVSQVEKWLIGFWVNSGCAAPCKRLSSWAVEPIYASQFWGESVRQKVANVAANVSHWRIIRGDWQDAPDVEATWFVDPPYVDAGRHYPNGPDAIDYGALGEWCRTRRGQVIACENVGADWLPFRPFMDIKSNQARSGRTTSAEAIWVSGCVEQVSLFDQAAE